MDQPTLFPIAELQTEGWAKPEPRDNDTDADVAETVIEAETA